MCQECSMRVTNMIHLYSVIRLKIQAYLCKKCCKQEYSKEALSWYNFNPKSIIIYPYDDKQIILLISMRNNNPELQYTGIKKIPMFSSSEGLKFVILVENSDGWHLTIQLLWVTAQLLVTRLSLIYLRSRWVFFVTGVNQEN